MNSQLKHTSPVDPFNVNKILFLPLLLLLLLFVSGSTAAQVPFEACTANLLNRSDRLNADGSFLIRNVPVNPGFFKVRFTCDDQGNTVGGQSEFIQLVANGFTEIQQITLGAVDPVPVSIRIDTLTTTLTTRDQTIQPRAFAVLPDSTTRDITFENDGTLWSSSNSTIASIGADGLITARGRGSALIQARNEGVVSSITINVEIPNDRDEDGITDEFEQANGLNPNDPTDAAQDLDGDGLSNLQEFQLGTNLRVADTDGDGLSDGEEANNPSTDALIADSDGDGLLDGDEIRLGTAPDNPDSDGDGLPDGLEIALNLDPLNTNPTTTLTGQIVDSNGAAVAGAAAIVLDRFIATSTSEGRFTLPNIPADQGLLQVFVRSVFGNQVADGFSLSVSPVIAGITDVGTITLQDVIGRVTGTVLSPRGDPVPNARVTVISGADIRAVNADSLGVYQADKLAAGAVTVLVTDIITGLRGRSVGVLAEQSAAVINVNLTAAGALTGIVIDRLGLATDSGVNVNLNGPRSTTTVTDIFSNYRFDFLPLGVYSLDASDADGNRGRTSAALTGTNQVIDNTIRFLGQGVVEGVVESATGVLIGGAEVTLNSRSLFGGSATVITGTQGNYRFDGIFLGDFDVYARDPATGLGGFTDGQLLAEGEVINRTVTLQPAATITGNVFDNDGLTPVLGAELRVSPSGRLVTTDSLGNYRLDALPLRVYTLEVTNPANGDRQRSVISLQTAGETVTQNINLNGLGTVNISVVDAGGLIVPDAQVILTCQSSFACNRQGMSDADGIVQFDNVLAGPFAVLAMDPVDQLGGNLSSNVLVNETVDLTVFLEAAGDIIGTVFAADGVTSLAGVRIELSPIGQQAISDSEGQYRFNMIPVARSPYSLIARDSNGAIRATVDTINLNAHGDQVSQDIILSGIGSVTGTVVNPDGSLANGIGVILNSDVSGSSSLFATTNADGIYQIGGIPEGNFNITASVPALRFAGVNGGVIAADGELVTVDIQMLEDQIPLTPGVDATLSRLFDANNFAFNIRQSGQIRDGSTAVFRGDNALNSGASRLTILDNGNSTVFTGNGGVFEDSGREIAIPGMAHPDLQITRKIFVPQAGYFARYLEILTNPTPTAITVDIQIDSHYRYFQQIRDGFNFNDAPRIISTFDGDGNFDINDRWVIVDDNIDADPFLSSNLPSVAQVIDGENGQIAANDASFEVDSNFGRISTRWENVSVNPGQTVILMHFVAQQTSRVAAQSSAQRLLQLPPEALMGLSSEERAAIINFDVPVDGSSLLSALPLLDGVLSGDVFEGDGETPINQAVVSFQSNHPLFGRTYSIRTSSDSGEYTFAGRLNNTGSSLAVPRTSFTVDAIHPQSGIGSPVESGDFSGATNAARDIVFDNTGQISGTVRRADGTVVSLGTVTASGITELGSFSVPIAIDGQYTIFGLIPDLYTLQATLPNTQGTNLSGVSSALIAAGQLTNADIVLMPTGGITGILRDGGGNPVINRTVDLNAAGFNRRVNTDTGGAFAFLDVPQGDYTLTASEPNTGVTSNVAIQVLEDQNIQQDLDFIALGRVQMQAFFPDTSPVANALVQIQRSALGSFFSNVGNTDSNGELFIENVPSGSFSLRVFNPINSSLVTTSNNTINSHGELVSFSVTVPTDQSPTVSLTSPVVGASFIEGSSVQFQANADDDLGINRVEFLVDGEIIGTDFSVPYTFTLILARPDTGTQRSLIVAAVDSSGQRTESVPVVVDVTTDTIPPIVDILTPVNGVNFIEGSVLSFQASASDNVRVAGVEFRAGGELFATDITAPYATNFTIPVDFADTTSLLELTASAIDLAGNSTSSSILVNVLPDQPPSINLIQSPSSGSDLFEGTTTRLGVTATDDRQVIAVDLLVDGQVQQTRSNPPFQFDLVLPSATDVNNPIAVTLRAQDSIGQTALTSVVELNVITDQPPTVNIIAPLANANIVEGSIVAVSVDANDDLGVTQVEFFVDGQSIGVDILAPFTGEFRLPGGVQGETVEIQAVATDTGAQTGSTLVQLVRIDDLIPPVVDISAPNDGAVLSVGPSDVAIVIDTSGSTGSGCGDDIDEDGINDSILKCEIFAAKELLNFLDPANTQVSVIDFSSNAILVQPLTQDFALAEQALDAILAAGPSGGTNFNVALQVATNELVSTRARREAAPVHLFMSDGSASLPTFELNRAGEGGVIVNTLAVGNGANTTVLQQMADATGGILTTVVNPADLVDILPNIILFGVDALPVIVNANDDIAVERVSIHVFSADGTIDETQVDNEAPFATLFDLPSLENALDVSVEATVEDFGGNTTVSPLITVTVLPAENNPEIIRLVPSSVVAFVPGQTVEIFGKFFAPTITDNLVDFNGLPATIISGNKIRLQVTVPDGASSGLVTLTANGLTSNAIGFGIDSDNDGLFDEIEISIGTDPFNPDTDGDGLADGEEVNQLGTDPLNIDSDNDGISDGDEVDNNLDPTNPADATDDLDGDGLNNAEELALGTGINDVDSDNDGLSDGEEVNTFATNPLSSDTDGGGRSDGNEVNIDITDPLDPSDDISADLIFEENIGTSLNLTDDSFSFVTFTDGFSFTFFGVTYTGVYVNSNGRLTFDFGDGTFTESLSEFNQQPQIAPFFDDLTPSGTIRNVFVNQFADRFVVTFNDIPEFPSTGSNTFQLIIFSDGRIQLGYKSMTARDAIVGISSAIPASFESDFSADTPFSSASGVAIYEQYIGGGDGFDLANAFLLFTPQSANSYDVDVLVPNIIE